MKKISILLVFAFILTILLTGCGKSPVKEGTYALGGDSTKQCIVIENGEMLKFVNFGEDYFITTFKIPTPDSEEYDEENYDIVKALGRGEATSYTVAIENNEVYIKTKIGEFLEIRLPYDKKTKTITFKMEKFTKI